MKIGTRLVATVATLLLAPGAFAQEAAPGGGDPGARFGRPGDPSGVESIRGTVAALERVASTKGAPPGIRMVLGTPAGQVPIHLGPAWYLERQERMPRAGEEVEVVGAKAASDGETAWIAAEVRMGDGSLVLRDAGGRPVWSAWRRATTPDRGERREPRALGSGGWEARGCYGRLYDPATVTEVTGVVETVERFMPSEGMAPGVRILLLTDGESLPVHLGPAWFLESQEVAFAAGDRVTVRGSRVPFGAGPSLLAAEVRRGEHVLTLRDEKGYPVWSGWRAREGGPAAGPAKDAPGCGLFDPRTVATIRGEVTRVERGRLAGHGVGTHIHVWTGEATYDVHLGPERFLKQTRLRFRAGDQVEITGSLVALDGASALVAARVRLDGTHVELRNEKGCPLWGCEHVRAP